MADITYIPIRQLHPHPYNPRKELGDLSELAASIKENGVYQNLTVIPGHYLSSREYISKCVDEGGDAAAAAAAWAPKVMWVGDDYTIIIGHRRAAAAQQATYQTHEHVNAYGKWGTKKEVIMPEDADKVAYVYKVSENQIDLYPVRHDLLVRRFS